MKKVIIAVLMSLTSWSFAQTDTVVVTFDKLKVTSGDKTRKLDHEVTLKIISDKVESFADLFNYDLNALVADMAENSADGPVTLLLTNSELNNYRKETKPVASETEDDEDWESDWESDWDEEDEDDDYVIDRDVTIVGKKDKKGRVNDNSMHFQLGMNNYLTSDYQMPESIDPLLAIKPLGSFYVAINNINETRIAHPLYLEWGFGISWYNLKLDQTNYFFQKTPDQTVLTENIQNEGDPVKSKLTINHLNFSMVPLIDFGGHSTNKFRIGLGGYVGYRISSWTKQVYEEGNDRERIKDWENYHLNNLRYGAQFRVGYKGLDVFANYDLNDLFLTNRGPLPDRNLNTWSIGLIF